MYAAIQFYAIALFAFLWFLIVREDVWDQKIRRRRLRDGLLLALAAYAALGLRSVLGWFQLLDGFLVWAYYRMIVLHLVVSCAAAFVLWWIRVWPAGDAKLFMLLALLYPLMLGPVPVPGSTFLTVLINSFLPASAVLFVRATGLMWRTRFRHQVAFLAGLGWRKGAGFVLDSWKQTLWLLIEGRAHLADYLLRPVALKNRAVWEKRFFTAVRLILKWGPTMVLTSLLMAALPSEKYPAFVVSFACFVFLSIWEKVYRLWEGPWLNAFSGLLCGVALAWGPAVDWTRFFEALFELMLFGTSVLTGVYLTRAMMARNFLAGLPVLGGGAYLLSALSFDALTPHWLDRSAFVWAAMGMFFGLAYIFVRFWSEEDHWGARPGDLKPRMVLSPSFVTMLRRDETFFRRELRRLYPDGLTERQVERLQRWCMVNSVAEVEVSQTISFSFWLFLGTGLTVVLHRHVLQYLF